VGISVSVGLWLKDESVIYFCCWASPVRSFSSPNQTAPMTTFYYLRIETLQIKRARYPYWYPPELGSPVIPPGTRYRPLPSLTQLLTRSLTHSINQSLTHWINHSITHSLNQSINHSLTHWINHSLTHWINQSLTHWINHSLTNSLTQSITLSLTESITHSLNHSLTQSSFSPPHHSGLPYKLHVHLAASQDLTHFH
jgi:hypothetical protein